MKRISSIQNPQIKTLKKLQEKAKKRTQNNQFVIEGTKELRYALDSNYIIIQVFILEGNFSSETVKLLTQFENKETHLYEVVAPLFKSLCYRSSTTEVLGVAQKKTHSLEQLKLKKNSLILITEAPEKPGNIGALIRTVDAANADALIITNSKTDLYNPNVIRSSVGCLFYVPIALCDNEELFFFLKKNNIKLYSAITSPRAIDYSKENYTSPTAIAVGSEDKGLSVNWCEQSKNHITIPMRGVNDSLNMSVAAGIILFEAVRQRNL